MSRSQRSDWDLLVFGELAHRLDSIERTFVVGQHGVLHRLTPCCLPAILRRYRRGSRVLNGKSDGVRQQIQTMDSRHRETGRSTRGAASDQRRLIIWEAAVNILRHDPLRGNLVRHRHYPRSGLEHNARTGYCSDSSRRHRTPSRGPSCQGEN